MARTIFSLVLVVLTALGLWNTYGDATEVQAKAREVACGAPGCPGELRQFSRSAIGQEYLFDTKSGSVAVSCSRAAIFVGDWACQKK
ncbi:MAG: hypothetical protein FJ104_04905 [Deltaproteobacteria bacterium]|nr:hypothetical protein [Deltaproteobacteria bacterium]